MSITVRRPALELTFFPCLLFFSQIFSFLEIKKNITSAFLLHCSRKLIIDRERERESKRWDQSWAVAVSEMNFCTVGLWTVMSSCCCLWWTVEIHLVWLDTPYQIPLKSTTTRACHDSWVKNRSSSLLPNSSQLAYLSNLL